MNSVCSNSQSTLGFCDQNHHTFSLTPIQKTLNSFNFQISFTLNALPVFNNDRSYFTQGFIQNTNVDLRPAQNSQRLFNSFAKQAQESLLLQPKPSCKKCYVCKEQFEDYLSHIQHKVHKMNLAQNQFSGEIYNLVNYFKMTTFKNRKAKDEKSRASQQNLNEAPKKRRIIENKDTFAPVAKVVFSEHQQSTKSQSHKFISK